MARRLDYSQRERLPETALHEIVIDDGLESDAPSSAGWLTPVVLFSGLFLTLILSRIGVRFFFLPIILPFGLGGGRLLRQFLPPPRRVLRLQEGTLWLAAEGPWKTTTLDRLDVTAGAFVALGTTGLWISGLEDARVRVVSSDGALTVSVRGGERARMLRQEIVDMFDADSVSALDHETPLRGDVWVEPFEDGEQIEWSSGGQSSGFFANRSATAVRVTPDAWALRVRAGGRPVVSTGGPGQLEARLVEAEHSGPLAASVVHDTMMLELLANHETVGRIGAELSEPELRWIAARIESASRVRH